jgi:hypothetical protein
VYLRDLKQLLRNLHNITQRLNIFNPLLHGSRMTLSRLIQNILDFLNLSIRPFLVHRPTILEDPVENAQQAECHDGFLVKNVEFIADGPD